MIDRYANLTEIMDSIPLNPRDTYIRGIAKRAWVSRIPEVRYPDMLAPVEKMEVRVMGKAKIFYRPYLSTVQPLQDYITDLIPVLDAYARVVRANYLFLDYYHLFFQRVLTILQNLRINFPFLIIVRGVWMVDSGNGTGARGFPEVTTSPWG